MTRTGEREIGAVSGRLPDNPGELDVYVDVVCDVTRDDSQRRFLAQHRFQMLEEYCSYSKQCLENLYVDIGT